MYLAETSSIEYIADFRHKHASGGATVLLLAATGGAKGQSAGGGSSQRVCMLNTLQSQKLGATRGIGLWPLLQRLL
jgi:hypothetical protein